ncbi:MAG TPA: hydroxyisourate hydrolase [Actinospica sp.]|jgi:5-hydroxyisourate hydrolase|nr:hydroxyisourate hydrolase [Actinospica sp.]
MSLSTHVLDAVGGEPAAGVSVRLYREDRLLAEAKTDRDGRIRGAFSAAPLSPGVHRLEFETGAYFAGRGTSCFYPQVAICFTVEDPGRHHHVPLLLSPFAYSTYRGS